MGFMAGLADKVALVTGGGSGIGLAVAESFLREGAKVAIAGRDKAKLEGAAVKLKGGERLICVTADVADSNQVQRMVGQITEHWRPVEILVNNAGLNIKERTLRALSPETWRLLVGANLDGAYYCIHAVLPAMLKRHDGLIVNISSVAGKRPNPLGGAAYAAAKAGM